MSKYVGINPVGKRTDFRLNLSSKVAANMFNAKRVDIFIKGTSESDILETLKKYDIPVKLKPEKYTTIERIDIIKKAIRLKETTGNRIGVYIKPLDKSKVTKTPVNSPKIVNAKNSHTNKTDKDSNPSVASGDIIYVGRYYLVQLTNRTINLISLDGISTHNTKISRGFKSIAHDINTYYHTTISAGISWFPAKDFNYVLEAK